MLIGEHSAKIGAKNRIAIPKEFREQFEGRLYITKGFGKTLLLVDEKRFSTIRHELAKQHLFDKRRRALQQYLLGSAIEIQYDLQGRFVMPQPLLTFAEISESATFIGVDNWIEVWETERWNTYVQALERNLESTVEKIITDSNTNNE